MEKLYLIIVVSIMVLFISLCSNLIKISQKKIERFLDKPDYSTDLFDEALEKEKKKLEDLNKKRQKEEDDEDEQNKAARSFYDTLADKVRDTLINSNPFGIDWAKLYALQKEFEELYRIEIEEKDPEYKKEFEIPYCDYIEKTPDGRECNYSLYHDMRFDPSFPTETCEELMQDGSCEIGDYYEPKYTRFEDLIDEYRQKLIEVERRWNAVFGEVKRQSQQIMLEKSGKGKDYFTTLEQRKSQLQNESQELDRIVIEKEAEKGQLKPQYDIANRCVNYDQQKENSEDTRKFIKDLVDMSSKIGECQKSMKDFKEGKVDGKGGNSIRNAHFESTLIHNAKVTDRKELEKCENRLKELKGE